MIDEESPAPEPPQEPQTGTNASTPYTVTYSQPQPATAPASRTWLPWVLVVAVLVIGAVVLGSVYLLTTRSNPVIDTIDPQPNLEQESDGYSAAQQMFEVVWNDFSYSDRQEMCKFWNAGLDDMFMETFMAEVDPSDIGATSTELESAVRDFLDSTC